VQLTEHFTEMELGVEGEEARLKESAKALCQEVLEPIRAHYEKAIRVHDGYRNILHNSNVGGKSTSWHLFQGYRAAADIDVPGVPLTELFRWIRLESKLPFDKAILEHTKDGIPRCVHLQMDMSAVPRRLAYVGETGAGQTYTPVEVA
jgi:zinc D-Ala-D-Ala carboxypeptidase